NCEWPPGLSLRDRPRSSALHERLPVDRDARVGWHRARDPAVATDDRTLADHRVTAEDGRSRVDHHVVLDGRVALLVLGRGGSVGLALGQAERAERDALVDAHVVAD